MCRFFNYELAERAANGLAQRRVDWARLAGVRTAILGRIPSGGAVPARPLEPVLGGLL
jgi:hypothetical protein